MTPSRPSERPTATSAAPWRARLRLIAALALALLLLGIGRVFDLQQHLTVESLRATVASAGIAGVGLYVILFCVGELLHVPGLVFVAAGVLAYGAGSRWSAGVPGGRGVRLGELLDRAGHWRAPAGRAAHPLGASRARPARRARS